MGLGLTANFEHVVVTESPGHLTEIDAWYRGRTQMNSRCTPLMTTLVLLTRPKPPTSSKIGVAVIRISSKVSLSSFCSTASLSLVYISHLYAFLGSQLGYRQSSAE
jgi:hypothetical protein